MITYMKTKNNENDEYPHFHVSGATFSIKDEDSLVDNELLQQYQESVSNEIEVEKSNDFIKEKLAIPAYAKMELTIILFVSIFAIFASMITILTLENIPLSVNFLIVGIGCIILFFPLLYLSKKVI